ncbi:MAG TPA: PVC-type heme-binding CxxCH protein [Verrucomicrobiales bacterium]|nr:PVC-type heme-binding CxxCH protein [Verrucomicrobiales bacterium]
MILGRGLGVIAGLLGCVCLTGADVDPQEVWKRFGAPRPAQTELLPFGERFDMQPEELLIFAGQTNLVREQKAGALEALLTAVWAERNPRFRSMAWEGDTVYEQRRDQDFGLWRSQLEWAGATAVLAQFGQMEALDGLERLPEFVAAYSRLLDEFAAATPRLVLLSPIPFERPEPPDAPDLRRHNESVRGYVEAIRSLARQRQAVFVDLFEPILDEMAAGARLTSNGIHLEDEGLEIVARAAAAQLGYSGERFPLLSELRSAVTEKNRLWFDCWRPMNWAFAYGERRTQLFGQPAGGRLWLRQELEMFKPLIAEQERRIRLLARGEASPEAGEPAVEPTAKPRVDGAEGPESAETMANAFSVGYGLEIAAFADETDGVINPIQMAWDAAGDLYVACSPTYPHVEPGARPGDYVLVCSDQDGDGIADRFHRFAEGLSMVQGLEPGAGGLWVCAGTELLHLVDSDGDGKADRTRVVWSGFGTGDAHQLINSISYGPDGRLWFTQGLHILSRVETPWGIASLERSGVWRYRPRSARLEGFFQNAVAGHNCWGVAFDAYAQPFHKSGDRPHGYYSLPGLIPLADPAEYHPVGALFDAPVKTTAMDWIETARLPQELQGCAVLGGFMGGTVDVYRVEEDGAGFRSERLPELARLTSEWFRPVDVALGPDGALYVCDFQNPVIGHYQASYRDPRRDRRHGRIWRVSDPAQPPAPRPDIPALAAPELLELLGNPERWTRDLARRRLFDLPAEDVLPAADALLNRIAAVLGSERNTRMFVDLGGIYDAHGAVREQWIEAAASAEDPRVRCVGMRWCGAWASRIEGASQRLLAGARDVHPRVRLEALVAAAQSPGVESMPVLEAVWSQNRDRFLDYALVNAARATRELWRGWAAALGGNGARDGFLAFLEQAAGAPGEEVPRGHRIYSSLCLTCHQAGGDGLPGIYPPLRDSERLAGPAGPLVQMLLHGLQGPLTTATGNYNGLMPASGLSDEDLAAVLSWTRERFAPGSGPVLAGEVARIREVTRDREDPWTAEELEQ